jgi:Protein of unknown function (DUF2911)
MFKALSLVFAGLLAAGTLPLEGQVRKTTNNKLSPPASTSMKLGDHTVAIEYNAPSARGRQVEGGLIPYGKVWRTGADAATTLTTDADLMIDDLKVPKGAYTIYTLAAPDGWLIIVNKQTGQWGTEYNESQDLGRVPLKLTALAVPVEKLEITLTADSTTSGTYDIKWGKTEASVPIKLAQ